MKKIFLLSIVCCAVLFSGCNKNKNTQEGIEGVARPSLTPAVIEPVNVELNDKKLVTYDSLKSYFVPRYETVLPEEPAELDAKQKIEDKSGKETQSVIPGVRKLSEYKTQYSTERKSTPKSQETVKAPEEKLTDDNPDDPFIIEDWGPSGSVAAENMKPTFYVIFSKPVRTLTALDEPSSTSDIMSITPALKGTFHWYGTRHLSFESEEMADPSIKYTIKIKSDLKSIFGQKLSGDTRFTTKAEPVKINAIFGGYEKKSTSHYNWSTGALPPYENRFLMRTNYMLTEEHLREELVVKVGSKKVAYKLEPSYDKNAYYWNYAPKSNEELKQSNSFIVTITDTVPHNTTVTAEIPSSKTSKYYNTLQPFNLTEVSKVCRYTEGKMTNPLYLSFSQNVDKKTVASNLSFNFDYTLTDNNISVNGSTVIIYGLPLDYDTEYKLYVREGIKDIYGQSLSSYKDSYSFKTRPMQAFVKYLDYGNKMMEAQFPHRLIFEHQNIEPGNQYTVRKVLNPIFNPSYHHHIEDNWYSGEGDSGYKSVSSSIPNQRNFEEVDLNPYLNNGYGFIRFQSVVNVRAQRYWSGEDYIDTRNNSLTLQITDLGITARVGINKVVVMVRSLTTNKPVTNADVYICKDVSQYSEDPMNSVFAKGKTDANGFAVITYTEEELAAYEECRDDEYRSEYPSVYVVNGDDKAIFTPTSHNMWRDGVYTSSILSSRNPSQRTFMFVDRGLYRPGETVTFRGIDKDQILGAMLSHKGDYKLKVQGSWWRAEEIVDPIEGSLSDTGGFWGSFKLDDDLEPGTYEISYFRKGETDNRSYSNFTVSFIVANFERVKFESSIKIPDITYYGGDKISAELSADYLAGGALSGASFNASWYKEKTNFTTKDVESRGYTFGTRSYYSSRNYYSDESGVLSSSGVAGLSCSTEKITDGSPYLYRVESSVTDISNQRISTSASVMVHSSQFYVGLKRPNSGYPKKGTKVEIPYILVGSDGYKVSENDLKAKVKSLKYSLSREVWTMVHEQSVDSTVYTRYESSQKEEASGSIDIKNKGNLTITPPEAGWYTLKVTGTDGKDNYVETVYEFYVTGGRAFWYDSNNSNSINLTPDQSQYNPGDTAQILLESPLPEGDYLVTVEREGIFTEEIKHFDSPANVIEIPVASNYVPVVYVSVSSYSMRTGAPKHQYGEVDLDKPKGYFGVTPLFINPYTRAFSVKVESDKQVYRPGDQVTLTMTATKGGHPVQGAELTVMAVDRGVLDLINYHVPNPIDYFYDVSHFPLRTRGGDSRDMLMDPVTYSIKDLQGGDSDGDDEKEDERKDFRPTAVFEPVLITGKDGTVTCSFKMPDSLTTYRITAFGVKEDLFALQEKEVQVQNPINVQQVQPKKLRERDTAECGVLITNLDNNGHDITVELEARTPTGNTVQDEQEGRKTVPGKAFIDGKNKHTVHVGPGQSSVVYFDVAAEQSGTVELVYTVSSDILNEKLISPVKIEKTYVYETVTMVGSTKDDAFTQKQEQFAIPGWAKDGRGDLSVTLDATRLGLLGSAVNYVFDYPYGCMEQQSSRVLPLVAFGDYIDVFGLDNQVGDIKKCVTSFTQNWGKLQHSDGGFGYWGSSYSSNLYVSIRIAQIYALAIQNGYTAEELGYNINSLKNFIAKSIRNYYFHHDNCEWCKYEYRFYKSYACYVMSLLNDNRLKDMYDQIYEERDQAPLVANAYLGMCYVNAGDKDSLKKANKIASEIRSYLKPVERTVTVISKDLKYSGYSWFSSEFDQMASILELFVSLKPKDEMVDRLLYTLLLKQSYGYWQNTSTTSAVLHSVYTYIKQRDLDSVKFEASATIKNKKVMTESFKGAGAKPKTLKLPFEGEILKKVERDTPVPIIFEKNGTGTLYYTVEMKYALPDEMQNNRNEGLGIEYIISDYETGEVINKPENTSSLLTLESGKLYKATVKVNTNHDRNYVALRAPIPSGAEILDSTFVTTGSAGSSGSGYSYRHWLSNKYIMDNEVQYFWDEFSTGATTVSFTFRANRRGVYPVPPVQAECMYEPEILGRSDGYLIQIK